MGVIRALVSIGARHAAAANADRLQSGAVTGENIAPLPGACRQLRGLGAVAEQIPWRLRRIAPHHRQLQPRDAVEKIGGALGGPRETAQKTFDMLRFPVGGKRQQYRYAAQFNHQADKIRHHARVIIAGKRILNDKHVRLALVNAHALQLLKRRGRGEHVRHLTAQRGLCDSSGTSTIPTARSPRVRSNGQRRKKLNVAGARAMTGAYPSTPATR